MGRLDLRDPIRDEDLFHDDRVDTWRALNADGRAGAAADVLRELHHREGIVPDRLTLILSAAPVMRDVDINRLQNKPQALREAA